MVLQLRSYTWFQDLMKLKIWMSHGRKNSVRDKVIGKEWIYLKRNTLHGQSVGHLRRRACMLRHFSHVQFFAIPWTIARQAPLADNPSMGIIQARILEWVTVPSSREIFPTQGLNPCLLCLPALAGRFFTTSVRAASKSGVVSFYG